MYKELGVEPLCSRREDHKLTTIFKILNGLSPTYMCDLLLPYLPTEPNYNLRSLGNQLRIPQCRTESYSKSFQPSTMRVGKSVTHSAFPRNTYRKVFTSSYEH